MLYKRTGFLYCELKLTGLRKKKITFTFLKEKDAFKHLENSSVIHSPYEST